MNHLEIKSKLMLKGTTQAAVARHLGVSSQVLGKVLRGKARSQRIEAELSRIVGQKINTNPLKRRGAPKSNFPAQVVA